MQIFTNFPRKRNNSFRGWNQAKLISLSLTSSSARCENAKIIRKNVHGNDTQTHTQITNSSKISWSTNRVPFTFVSFVQMLFAFHLSSYRFDIIIPSSHAIRIRMTCLWFYHFKRLLFWIAWAIIIKSICDFRPNEEDWKQKSLSKIHFDSICIWDFIISFEWFVSIFCK